MVSVLLAIGRVNLSPSHRGHGGGDDGRGLGAQTARAELLERAAARSCRLQFVFREAAFGADEEGWPMAVGRWPMFGVGVEDDPVAFAFDDLVERRRLFDFRDARSAGLLLCLERELAPALLFAAIALGAHLDALGDYRDGRADAERGRFLQHELELFELDDGHGQMHFDCRLAVGRGGGEADGVAFVEAEESCAAAVEDFDLFAFAHAHHARVVALVRVERDHVAGGEITRRIKAMSHAGDPSPSSRLRMTPRTSGRSSNAGRPKNTVVQKKVAYPRCCAISPLTGPISARVRPNVALSMAYSVAARSRSHSAMRNARNGAVPSPSPKFSTAAAA